jgi:hypothetical protein
MQMDACAIAIIDLVAEDVDGPIAARLGASNQGVLAPFPIATAATTSIDFFDCMACSREVIRER